MTGLHPFETLKPIGGERPSRPARHDPRQSFVGRLMFAFVHQTKPCPVRAALATPLC